MVRCLRTGYLSRCTSPVILSVGRLSRLTDVFVFVVILGSYDCNGTKAQKWVINRGDTKVRVAGTDFCLDAGSRAFCVFVLPYVLFIPARRRPLLIICSAILLLTDPTSGVRMKIWKCYDNLPAQAW